MRRARANEKATFRKPDLSGLETFTPEKPKLGLGATESFVDDFFWSRWRFEISIFDLVSIGRG